MTERRGVEEGRPGGDAPFCSVGTPGSCECSRGRAWSPADSRTTRAVGRASSGRPRVLFRGRGRAAGARALTTPERRCALDAERSRQPRSILRPRCRQGSLGALRRAREVSPPPVETHRIEEIPAGKKTRPEPSRLVHVHHASRARQRPRSACRACTPPENYIQIVCLPRYVEEWWTDAGPGDV